MDLLRGKGVLKPKILKATYDANLGFLGGRGCKTKKPSVEGVWIFSGTTH